MVKRSKHSGPTDGAPVDIPANAPAETAAGVQPTKEDPEDPEEAARRRRASRAALEMLERNLGKIYNPPF